MNTEKYIKSQSQASKPMTVNDMVCRNCLFKSDELPTAHCNMYRPGESYKPASVLLGKLCPKFRRRIND